MTRTHKRPFMAGGLLVALWSASGCAFYARGPEDYRKAVREVLDGQRGAIESCYRGELNTDQAAAGKVVVRFDVEPKTGNIVQPQVISGESSGSEALQRCVLGSLSGLKLEPPDQRKGEATFSWQFSR